MSFKYDNKGLKKIQKKFDDMQEKAEELDEGKNVQLSDLFTDSFLQEFTEWENIHEFEKELPVDITKHTDKFQFIDEPELNEYINNNSTFQNWNEFINKAAELYTLKHLGL